jgi:hypothetical protein
MNGTRLRNGIVSLSCSDALALALGALPVEPSARGRMILKEHMPGVAAGAVIAVITTSDENYLWPCQGAA